MGTMSYFGTLDTPECHGPFEFLDGSPVDGNGMLSVLPPAHPHPGVQTLETIAELF